MSDKEKKVSDHAAADAPDTTVVGTNDGQGQPVESTKEVVENDVVEDAPYDRKKQEELLRRLGVTEDNDKKK